MKNFLLPFLITLSTTILAKTPESLFGVYINDNVLDYVTKKELKSKVKDRARGFYYLELKNPPVHNKNYSDIFWVRLDKNNKIAAINSEKEFQNSETCKDVEYQVRRTLETKYNFEFERDPKINYVFQKWFGDIVITTQCRVFDNHTTLFINLVTEEYNDKYREYFESNI